MDASSTIPDLLAQAISAEEALAELGETIDDEWSYVNDLCRAWTDRLSDVAASWTGNEPADPALAEAIRLAIDEAGQISDPHRAIDWLSTLPQIVLIAVGG